MAFFTIWFQGGQSCSAVCQMEKPLFWIFLQGDCFIGELELLSVRKSTMGVKALSTCFLLALPIEKYRQSPVIRCLLSAHIVYNPGKKRGAACTCSFKHTGVSTGKPPCAFCAFCYI